MTLSYFLVQVLDVADKYFIVAGMAFLVGYVLLRKRIGRFGRIMSGLLRR